MSSIKVVCSKQYLLVVFSAMVAISSTGQNPRIDSLLRDNERALGVTKSDILYELAYEFIDLDNTRALMFTRESMAIAMGLGDSLRIVKACRLQSSAYRRIEVLDSAISAAKFGLDISTRNGYDSEKKILLNSLAIAHSLRGDYHNALFYLSQTLEIRTNEGKQDEISIVLNNLGVVYYKMKIYDKAFQFFERSALMKEMNNEVYHYDISLTNAGVCLVYMGKYDEANYFFDKAISFYGDTLSSFAQAMVHYGRGLIEFNLEKYDQAKAEFWKSYEIGSTLNDYRVRADNLLLIGKINFIHGNPDVGFNSLLEVERIAEQYKYREMLISVLEELIKNYRQLGDVNSLLHYQHKYILLKNEIYNTRLIDQMTVTEVKLKRLENQETLARQEELLRLNYNLLTLQKRIITTGAGLLLLILTGVVIFVRRYRIEKRINSILSSHVKSKTKHLERMLELRSGELYHHKLLFQYLMTCIFSKSATLKGLENISKSNYQINDTKLFPTIPDFYQNCVKEINEE